MPPQTVVLDHPTVGFEGDIAYHTRSCARESGINGDAASIAFGRGIVIDGDDETFDLPTSAAEIANGFFMIAWRDPTKDGGGPYAPGDKMTGVRKGYVCVKVEEAVTKGGAVYCRYAAGGDGLGAFRASTGTDEAAAVPNAKFASSAGAGKLAIVELA